MNAENICLITPIDQNKNVLCWDGNLHKRYFEDECLRMIKYWRKYAGWLKNINIYVYNVNGANISSTTIDRLSEYGCIYNVMENNVYSDMGFLTEPLCGKLAEEEVKEDILIKIDLDMCITRPLEKYLIEESENYTLIEQYSDYDAKYQRNKIGDFNPFDTCFIISKKQNQFYKIYYDLCYSKLIDENVEWKKIQEDSGNYYLEEFVIDYMYKNNICNIKPMINHIYGEGYKEMKLITDDEFRQINFIHCHINKENPNIENKIFKDYIFRSCQRGIKK